MSEVVVRQRALWLAEEFDSERPARTSPLPYDDRTAPVLTIGPAREIFMNRSPEFGFEVRS
eukprot:11929998-Alexandrium_andersonii.AAC.1